MYFDRVRGQSQCNLEPIYRGILVKNCPKEKKFLAMIFILIGTTASHIARHNKPQSETIKNRRRL